MENNEVIEQNKIESDKEIENIQIYNPGFSYGESWNYYGYSVMIGNSDYTIDVNTSGKEYMNNGKICFNADENNYISKILPINKKIKLFNKFDITIL